jgi:hypothetical protein
MAEVGELLPYYLNWRKGLQLTEKQRSDDGHNLPNLTKNNKKIMMLTGVI